MNKYNVLQQWVNGNTEWTVFTTEMTLNEFWKSYKATCESMGMKLIAITLTN